MVENLRVACVQIQAHDVDESEVALREALEAVDRATAQGARLVLLPECVYPAYMLREWGRGSSRQAAVKGVARATRAFSAKALQHRCYLAAGLVEIDGGAFYNSALLFDPDGRVIGRARKHFLWHFDSSWFEPGTEFGVAETPWGGIGMLVCADARIPEVPRALRLRGARIILDLTNWTSTGKDPAALTNPQVDYMLRTRALENGVWFVAADKVGIEQDSIVYCGSSCVVSPRGEMLARASSHRPEILMFDIPGSDPANRGTGTGAVDGRLDPVADRKPQEYGILSMPCAELPIARHLEEGLVPGRHAVQTAAVQLGDEVGDPGRWASAVRRYLAILAEQKVGLAVFSEPSGSRDPGAFLPVLDAALAHSRHVPDMTLVLAGPESRGDGCLFMTGYAVAKGQIVGKYRKLHPESHEAGVVAPGDLGLPVFSTPAGNVGIMLGYEGLIPEVARVLAVEGADLIAWPADFATGHFEHVARTRASESRVFLVVANSSEPGAGESMIVEPGGMPLARGFTRRSQVVSALCNVSASRVKTVVPGTNVILGRQPSAYCMLCG